MKDIELERERKEKRKRPRERGSPALSRARLGDRKETMRQILLGLGAAQQLFQYPGAAPRGAPAQVARWFQRRIAEKLRTSGAFEHVLLIVLQRFEYCHSTFPL